MTDSRSDRPDTAPHSAQLFPAIMEAAAHADIAVVVTSSKPGEIDALYLNDAAERMVGLPREEIARRGLFSFIAPEELSMLQGFNDSRAVGGDMPTAFRTVVVHATGRRIPVEVTSGLIMLDGQPATVSFIADVSRRAAVEDAVQRSEKRFRELIENAPDGVAIVRWPKIAFVNPVAATMLGFPRPQDAIGQDITTRLSEADARMAEARIRRLEQGQKLREPRQYRSRDTQGRELTIEISSIPIEFEGTPAVLAFARDVTERNAILAKLAEADKLGTVATLAAGVAHEINNPLAYVLLNLELLARDLPELARDASRLPAMQRRLEDMRQGADRMRTIIRDLQALTRKEDATKGPVELDQALDHALYLARHELRGARVVRSFDRVACTCGNPMRIEQLFYNLIVNAAHAACSADHGIYITLMQDAADTVVVEIKDTGSGMNDEALSRVFEPFFTTKPLGVGSGLGLPICKRIVDDLAGTIEIESREGHGTTVRVVLPAHPDAPARGEGAATHTRGRLLIVDDERAVADSLRFALTDEHDVDTATSAKEARAALAAGHDYDVVLCDLVMPGESGMELHAFATTHHPDLAARFVFMTGGAFTPAAVRFLSEVQSRRIEKPFELEALRALIHELVRARRS